MSMERNRNATRTRSLGGGGDLLSAPDDAGGIVTISHVPHEERVAAAGMTVGQVRARYRDRFDIDPQSQAFIDGSAVNDDTVLRTGQNLMFMRHSGEKGSSPWQLSGEGSPAGQLSGGGFSAGQLSVGSGAGGERAGAPGGAS